MTKIEFYLLRDMDYTRTIHTSAGQRKIENTVMDIFIFETRDASFVRNSCYNSVIVI